MKPKHSLILGQTETYDCSTERIRPFRKVTDIVEGTELSLSNIADGFPFVAAGRIWASSEQLYLCGEFTDAAIQEEIYTATSGYAAGRFIKAKYCKEVRKDFADYHLQWMLWCVWQKCKGNADFRSLLTSIPGDVILVDLGSTELEHKINIEINGLGNVGTFTGRNNIGKILMICRKCLIEGTEPVIDFAALQDAHIMLFGKELTFKLAVKRLKDSRDTADCDPECISLRMCDGNTLSSELKNRYLRGRHDRIAAEFGYRISFRSGLTLGTEVDALNNVTAAGFETFSTVVTYDYNDAPNLSCSPHLDSYFQSLGYPSARVDTSDEILRFFTHLIKEVPQASYYFRIVE